MKRSAMWVGVVALALVDVAKAQGPVTDPSESTKKSLQEQERIFYNDQILRKSVLEIIGMSEAELRALTRYFSECEKMTDQATHGCSVAESAYLIEFGPKSGTPYRSIDSWIAARSGIAQDTEIYAQIFRKTQGVDIKKIGDRVAIEGALRDAINQRFRDLRSKQQTP